MRTRPCPEVLAVLGLWSALWLVACGLPAGEGDPDSAAIFVEDRLVLWELTITEDNWRELLLHPDEYVPIDALIDGVRHRDVGLRLTGNPNRPKLGLRLRFNRFRSGARFHGVRRVNLRNAAGDPSLVREALALGLMRQAGVPAPRSSFVWVSWGSGGGVYTLAEQVDRKFLEDRFGEKDGYLYKLERGAHLVYRGDDPAGYDWTGTYALKTDVEIPDHGALIELMKALDRSTPDELEQRLPELLDVDGWLRLVAVNTWLANMDAYAGTADNLFLYRGADGRFRAIPWDMNRAFGNYHGRHLRDAVDEDVCRAASIAFCAGDPESADLCSAYFTKLCGSHHEEFCWTTAATPGEAERCAAEAPLLCRYTTDEQLTLDPDAPTCSPDRPLVHRVLAVRSFRARYHQILAELIDSTLAPASVEARLGAMRSRIAGAAAEDMWKDCNTEEDFDASFESDVQLDPEASSDERVPGLVPFIRAQDEHIRALLQGESE